MELQPRNDSADPRKRLGHSSAAGATKRAHPRAQAPRSCARGDAGTAACSALPRTRTRVGRIRPLLAFGRGVATTLETLPGSRREDRGVTQRCPRLPCPTGLRDPGLPGGERGSSPSKFVARWTGLLVARGDPPVAQQVWGPRVPKGKGRSGSYLEQTAGFLRVTRAASSSRSSVACASRNRSPLCSRPRGLSRQAVGHRGLDRTRGGHLPRQPHLSPLGETQSRFLPASSRTVRCKLTATPLARPLRGGPRLAGVVRGGLRGWPETRV